MDISKLPRLSNQPAPPPPEPEPPPSARPPPALPTSSRLAEMWICIGFALILLYAFPNGMKFLMNPNSPDLPPLMDGTPYRQTLFMWQDLGVTAFAVVLLLDGLTLSLARKPAVLIPMLAITVATAFFNIFVILHTKSAIGLPLVCALGVVICVYLAILQFAAIGESRRMGN